MGQIRNEKIITMIAMVLKELRQESGVSQEDVYHVTRIHVGRIESCNSNPSISTLAALAGFFNISLVEFFGRVENKRLPEKGKLA